MSHDKKAKILIKGPIGGRGYKRDKNLHINPDVKNILINCDTNANFRYLSWTYYIYTDHAMDIVKFTI